MEDYLELCNRIKELEHENEELKQTCKTLWAFSDDLYNQVGELKETVERLCSEVYGF